MLHNIIHYTYIYIYVYVYTYMAVALNRGISRCPDPRLCYIRMSRPLVSYVCRGVCRGCFARCLHACVVEGCSSKKGLVVKACRGGLLRRFVAHAACRKQNGFVTNPMSLKDAREPVTYLDFGAAPIYIYIYTHISLPSPLHFTPTKLSKPISPAPLRP